MCTCVFDWKFFYKIMLLNAVVVVLSGSELHLPGALNSYKGARGGLILGMYRDDASLWTFRNNLPWDAYSATSILSNESSCYVAPSKAVSAFP